MSFLPQQESSPVVIVYHYPCPDGAFAALAAHLYFNKIESQEQEVSFVPQPVYQTLDVNNPVFKSNTHVYMVDYFCGKAVLDALCSKVHHVMMLDHHKTAWEDIESLVQENKVPHNFQYKFEKSMSGATVAYQFFDQKLHTTQGVHLIEDEEQRNYIQDNDIWTKALPRTEGFQRGLELLELEYSTLKNDKIFETLLSLDVSELQDKGDKQLETDDRIINQRLDQSFKIVLGGSENKEKFGEALAVHIPSEERILLSKIGNRLSIKSRQQGLRGAAAVICEEPNMKDWETKYKISLRSLDQEDISIIAKTFGGGGHLNAASFILDRKTFNDEWTCK
ncbi:hypothetical protein AKO1_011562 [Acrasis kona]|uniref:DHHA1 domain-containing protein n=1 Tax=Acrasis kona TaxID=1008807 RepID=A0AAW2ZIK8_9EUKA